MPCTSAASWEIAELECLSGIVDSLYLVANFDRILAACGSSFRFDMLYMLNWILICFVLIVFGYFRVGLWQYRSQLSLPNHSNLLIHFRVSNLDESSFSKREENKDHSKFDRQVMIWSTQERAGFISDSNLFVCSFIDSNSIHLLVFQCTHNPCIQESILHFLPKRRLHTELWNIIDY